MCNNMRGRLTGRQSIGWKITDRKMNIICKIYQFIASGIHAEGTDRDAVNRKNRTASVTETVLFSAV